MTNFDHVNVFRYGVDVKKLKQADAYSFRRYVKAREGAVYALPGIIEMHYTGWLKEQEEVADALYIQTEGELQPLDRALADTTGTGLREGVHITHCCARHGCKYAFSGEPWCPVVTGKFIQSDACEECLSSYEEGEDAIAEAQAELAFYKKINKYNEENPYE